MSEVKLTYSQLLSSKPTYIGIGHIKPPTVNDRWDLGEGLWGQYTAYVSLTLDNYYCAFLPDKYDDFLNLPFKERTSVNLFDLISEDSDILLIYVNIFNFFFVEKVIYKIKEKRFELYEHLKQEDGTIKENITGYIDREIFDDVLAIIMQFTNIHVDRSVSDNLSREEDDTTIYIQRRNDKLAAKRGGKRNPLGDSKYDVGNVISVVCAYGNNGINVLNVGDVTMFNLYDQFQRILIDRNYQIMARNASVYGTEGSEFKEDSYLQNFHSEN